MTYTPPKVTEWMNARDYLIECGLPINLNGTGSKKEVQALRAYVSANFSSGKRKRIQSYLTTYLEPSQREYDIFKLYKQISGLLYEIQSAHVTDYDTMCFMSKLSADATVYLKRRHHSDVVLLIEMRDALLETCEFLRQKNKEGSAHENEQQ